MFTKFTRQNIVKKKETTSVSAGQKMTLSNPLVVRMFEIFEDQSRTTTCQSTSKHAVEPFEASKSFGMFFGNL